MLAMVGVGTSVVVVMVRLCRWWANVTIVVTDGGQGG